VNAAARRNVLSRSQLLLHRQQLPSAIALHIDLPSQRPYELPPLQPPIEMAE
jgi:hypothetical protein